MKFLKENYRVVSIWLSLIILVLGFLIGSDEGSRPVATVLIFLAGTLLYFAGSIHGWVRNRMMVCLIEAVLTAVMLTGALLSLLRLGGII